MGFNNYWKILLITLVVFSSSCIHRTEKMKSDFYIAKRDFGGVSNRIKKTKLDSVISQLPYWTLNEFKTTDFTESIATEILTNDFRTKGLNTNEFIIYEIKKPNDSIVVFYLNHFDSFVYKYNLDKLNSVLAENPTIEGWIETIPPITGNISGYEGWYIVNLKNKDIKITYAQ